MSTCKELKRKIAKLTEEIVRLKKKPQPLALDALDDTAGTPVFIIEGCAVYWGISCGIRRRYFCVQHTSELKLAGYGKYWIAFTARPDDNVIWDWVEKLDWSEEEE